jgi:hypothetical protein
VGGVVAMPVSQEDGIEGPCAAHLPLAVVELFDGHASIDRDHHLVIPDEEGVSL